MSKHRQLTQRRPVASAEDALLRVWRWTADDIVHRGAIDEVSLHFLVPAPEELEIVTLNSASYEAAGWHRAALRFSACLQPCAVIRVEKSIADPPGVSYCVQTLDHTVAAYHSALLGTGSTAHLSAPTLVEVRHVDDGEDFPFLVESMRRAEASDVWCTSWLDGD